MSIGRTSDNDIVLYDPGVSRKHARLFEKGGKYFAEDCGSANGTKLNGEPLQVAKELKNGDSVAVGPVVFAFAQAVQDPNATMMDDGLSPVAEQSTRMLNAAPEPAPAEDPNATRIKDLSELLPPAPAPEPEDPNATRIKDLSELQPSLAGAPQRKSGVQPGIKQTGARKSLSETPVSPSGMRKSGVAPSVSQSGKRNAIPNNAASTPPPDETMPPSGSVPARVSSPGRSAVSRASGEASIAGGAPGSAAERLRKRRQYGDTLGGQLAYLWSELSTAKKGAIVGSSLLFVIGTVVGLYFLFKPAEEGKQLPEEPVALTRQPIPYSFGLGDEVDYDRGDQKIFNFEFASATRAVAVVRYQSANVSQGEVSITLNGVEQGFVPPDTLDRDREEEQLLSPKDLKKGETNQLIFDNTKNPPGKETWQISNISVEVIPIPEGTDDELKSLASEYAKKGKEYYDSRDIGADNLFRAWKSYRSAWLTLEAMNEKPELYTYVRESLATSARELDGICRRMMLDIQRSIQLKNGKKAAQTLDEIDRYFPTNEHRCHNQAHALKQKLEL